MMLLLDTGSSSDHRCIGGLHAKDPSRSKDRHGCTDLKLCELTTLPPFADFSTRKAAHHAKAILYKVILYKVSAHRNP